MRGTYTILIIFLFLYVHILQQMPSIPNSNMKELIVNIYTTNH